MAVISTGFVFGSLQSRVAAQSVLAPPPEGFGAPTTLLPASSTNQAYTADILPTQEPAPLPKALQWGPVDVRPHMLYRFIYGDGIQAAPGQASKTVINEVSPGVLFDLGKNWTLDYTPTLRYYSSSQFQNSVDQNVSLHGAATYNEWKFGLQQSYVKTTQPLIETGAETEQESYLTSFVAAWEMNSSLSLQLGFAQSFLSAESFQSINQWTTPNWIDYRVEPGLSVGVGVTLGYDGLSASPDETFEQGQARIQWSPGDKLSLQASGGGEVRQLGGGAPDLVSPVFGASLTYQPFKHTRLTASLSRSVAPSLYQNQVQTTTSFGASLRQELSRKWSVSVSGSYLNSPYQTTQVVPSSSPFVNNVPGQPVVAPPTEALAIDRVDNQWSITVDLSWAATANGTASVFYAYSQNTAGLSAYQYSSTQVGLALGYRF